MNTGPVNAGPTNDRASELAVNLAAVDLRIAQACADAGRDRAEVTLVVVTSGLSGHLSSMLSSELSSLPDHGP